MTEFARYYCDHPEFWFAKDRAIDEMLCEKFAIDFIDGVGMLDKIAGTHPASIDDPFEMESFIDVCILIDQLGRHLKRLNAITEAEFDAMFAVVSRFAFLFIANKNAKESRSWQLVNLRRTMLIFLIVRHTFSQINVLFIKNQIVSILGAETDPVTKKLLIAFYEKTINVLISLSPPALCENIAMVQPIVELPKQKSMHQCFNSIAREIVDDGIILSFSGGVDSSLLLDEYSYLIKACVYVNYGNRKETRKELEHVIGICKQHNKTLYVRHITELYRKHGNESYAGYREFYELITRRIRFAAYTHVLAETQSKHIMLGHNHDDIVENIITNIRNRDHYDNLNGMTTHSQEQDVSLFRPILHLTKDTIKTIAHKREIISLPNSTPEWSMRGMIRKELTHSNVFTEAFTDGLIEVSTMLQNYYKIIDKYVKETQFTVIPPPKNKNTSGITVSFAIPQDLANNTAFISGMFHKITTAYSIPNISKKAITDFTRRHQTNNFIILSGQLSWWGPPVPNPGQGASPLHPLGGAARLQNPPATL